MAEAAASLESSTKSAARSGSVEDIPLIEERVDPGLSELLSQYEPAHKITDVPVDTLNDRFTIFTSQPVPAFDTQASKAYVARDAMYPERAILAYVLDPNIPYRQSAIDGLKGFTHPNLSNLYDAGTIKLGDTLQLRETLFVERPAGRPLSEIFAEGKRFHERHLIDQILTPLIEGLAAMQERGISHGRINPKNLYIDQQLMLGECVSETQGLSQDMLFEPLERLMAEPMAKGAATPKSDAYAVGMVAYEALFGVERIRELDRPQLIRLMLEKGSYHALVATKELGELFTDFFRGVFNENKQERWGLDQLQNWLTGKRFNLIMPSLPSEASRPFEFMDREFFSCRSLANGLYQNWTPAAKQIRKARLDRWLEMSAHKSEMADKIVRIIRAYGGEVSAGARTDNEMLARIITTLDPFGPMRCKTLSLNVDGMGLAIAHYFKQRDNANIQLLLELISNDLPNFWADNNTMEKTQLTTTTLWTLQRVRMHLKYDQVGFGLERIVYDLNPSLPCQNEWLLPYHAKTVEEALIILDNLAKDKAATTSLADRHLAAFLASRIELLKEVKFNQLARLPSLRNNQELVALRILSMAQDKRGKMKLVGLATWAAMRIDKLIDNIHSRKLRKKIRENLKSAAKTGSISRVLAVMVENDLTRDDHNGFTRANAVYFHNQGKIEALRNQQTIDHMAKDLGGRIAVFTAYIILTITIYVIVDSYHFY